MIELNISKELIITNKKTNGKVFIETPILHLPFGLEKEYNNLYLKLQLRKTHDKEYNNELDNLLETLQSIEEQIEKKLGKNIKSQIRLHEKYDPIIITKVPVYKGKTKTEFFDKDGSPFNIYNLEKGSFLKAKLQFDRIFEYNGSLVYKIKVVKIKLV
jgi:hypothetical protein